MRTTKLWTLSSESGQKKTVLHFQLNKSFIRHVKRDKSWYRDKFASGLKKLSASELSSNALCAFLQLLPPCPSVTLNEEKPHTKCDDFPNMRRVFVMAYVLVCNGLCLLGIAIVSLLPHHHSDYRVNLPKSCPWTFFWDISCREITSNAEYKIAGQCQELEIMPVWCWQHCWLTAWVTLSGVVSASHYQLPSTHPVSPTPLESLPSPHCFDTHLSVDHPSILCLSCTMCIVH